MDLRPQEEGLLPQEKSQYINLTPPEIKEIDALEDKSVL